MLKVLSKLAMAGAVSLLVCSLALAAEYEEGVHYERVIPPQPTSTKDKVEVLEIFWYGCPSCFRFEPYVARWLKRKPDNAEFVLSPGVFNASWEVGARAYYIAKLLGVLDKIHTPLFNALHLQKRKLNTEDAMRDFFAEQGVDKLKFIETYRSFPVEMSLRRAKMKTSRYGVRGVPAVIVNGKYRISPQSAGGYAEMMKVVNFLVKKES